MLTPDVHSSRVASLRSGSGSLGTAAVTAVLIAPAISRFDLLAAALAVLGISAGGFVLFRSGRWERLTLWCLGYVGYLAAVGAIVGSLFWRQLAFWQGEGRSLLAISAIGIVAAIPLGSRQIVTIAKLLIGIGVAVGILAAVYELSGLAILTQPNDAFTGLTSSHHVQGSIGVFYGGLLLLMGRTAALPSRLDGYRRLALAGYGFGMLSSFSRIGMFSAALGAIVVLALHRRDSAGVQQLRRVLSTVTVLRTAIALIVAALLLFLTPLASQLSIPNPLDSSATSVSDGREYNVLQRFNLWNEFVPIASESPILGVGPWRINDDSERHLQPFPGVSLGLGPSAEIKNFTTHNLFLQLMGDAGLVGIAWLIGFIMLVRDATRRQSVAAEISGYFLLTVILVQGVTGTSIVTTAVALPFAGCLAVARHLVGNVGQGHTDQRDVGADQSETVA